MNVISSTIMNNPKAKEAYIITSTCISCTYVSGAIELEVVNHHMLWFLINL